MTNKDIVYSADSIVNNFILQLEKKRLKEKKILKSYEKNTVLKNTVPLELLFWFLIFCIAVSFIISSAYFLLCFIT